MNDNAMSKILCDDFEELHRKKIRKTNGYEFSVVDMGDVVIFFEKEKSAMSITYDAWIQIECQVYDGYVTIWRDGSLQIALKH